VAKHGDDQPPPDPGSAAQPPAQILEYAEQAVVYVKRALGIGLEYDSDTLPLLDHYLRTVAKDASDGPATLKLVVATAGAYFGEVVRRRVGGRWSVSAEESDSGTDDPQDPKRWRMVLTTGLHFSPAGFVASNLAQADLEDLDSEFDAPERMRPYVEQALARMGEISVAEYYSLCGRLDTLEHVHEVLVAVAAKLLGEQNAGLDGESEAESEPESETESESSVGVAADAPTEHLSANLTEDLN
jgi:hypothetical protein